MKLVYERFESIFSQVFAETGLLEPSEGMLNIRERCRVHLHSKSAHETFIMIQNTYVYAARLSFDGKVNGTVEIGGEDVGRETIS